MKSKKLLSVLSASFLIANFVNFNYVAAGKVKLNVEHFKKVCNCMPLYDEMKLWCAVQKNICYLNDKDYVLDLPKNIKWRMLMDVQYQYGDEGMYALDRLDKGGNSESNTLEPGYINALLNAWGCMTESIQENKKLNADLYIKLHDLAVEKVYTCQCTKHMSPNDPDLQYYTITGPSKRKPGFVRAERRIYKDAGLKPKNCEVHFGLKGPATYDLGNFTDRGLEELKRKQTKGNNWFGGAENQLLKHC